MVANLDRGPARGPDVVTGYWNGHWGDRGGRQYDLVTGALTPAEAQRLAIGGAAVVYDACGRGGQERDLDWLTRDEVTHLAAHAMPVIHQRKHGRADLEHWRSLDGRDPIVAAVDVSWGDRFG